MSETLTLHQVRADLAEWLDRWPYFDKSIIEFVEQEILADGEAGVVDRALRKKGPPASQELRKHWHLNSREIAGSYLTYLTEAAESSDKTPKEMFADLINAPLFAFYDRRKAKSKARLAKMGIEF